MLRTHGVNNRRCARVPSRRSPMIPTCLSSATWRDSVDLFKENSGCSSQIHFSPPAQFLHDFQSHGIGQRLHHPRPRFKLFGYHRGHPIALLRNNATITAHSNPTTERAHRFVRAGAAAASRDVSRQGLACPRRDGRNTMGRNGPARGTFTMGLPSLQRSLLVFSKP